MKFGAFSSLLVTLALVCSSVVDAEPIEATSATFDSLVLKKDSAVAVLFCETNDYRCSTLLGMLDLEVSKLPPVTGVYVFTDKYPDLAKRYKVKLPFYLVGFYNGEPVAWADDFTDRRNFYKLAESILEYKNIHNPPQKN